jgi:hypothetical protein
MSGSPVYVDGKLIGAIALRLSQFSPDAICGITPIESMLEIQEMDVSRPSVRGRQISTAGGCVRDAERVVSQLRQPEERLPAFARR